MSNLPSPIEFPDAWMQVVGDTFYSVFGAMMGPFEVTLRQALPAFTAFVDEYFTTNRSPLNGSDFPLANPYSAMFAIWMYFVGLFVFFVVGRLTGPLKLKGYGIIHNFILAVWSLYMAVGVVWEAYNQGFSVWGNKVGSGPAAHSMAKFCWLFYVSKVPEFIDTYIMMLKHNYRQISFLHVFHHSSVLPMWTVAINVAPGGDCYFNVVQNSAVHVIMYTYYLLNLLFPEGTSVRRVLQKNKFFITYLQILQFVSNLGQSVYQLAIADAPFNRDVMVLQLWYMIALIILFSNFLIRNRPANAVPKGRAQQTVKVSKKEQ